ncbi:hypothetical protein AB0C29_18360 [Actinoplanes sp. NPDC048791]|uniref:hypothetical protein n=1 Tax=Actinoplanes sp. NPDC048791 TaxID=3154623 RepID=UPI003411C326
MRLRRTAVAALLAAGIVVPAVGTAATAFAQPGGKPVSAQKAHPKPNKTKKPVRTPFAASGKVTAVDAAAGTVTLLASGGTKDVRRQTVTVTVPGSLRVVVNGKRTTLKTVAVGARITVNGTRVGTAYTATKVSVTQKKGAVVKPTPTPTVSPTPQPTPPAEDTPVDETPTDDTPTAEPTPTTSPEPDEDPTEDPEDEISDDLSA